VNFVSAVVAVAVLAGACVAVAGDPSQAGTRLELTPTEPDQDAESHNELFELAEWLETIRAVIRNCLHEMPAGRVLLFATAHFENQCLFPV
jgi:hypothetical protein